MWDSLIFLLWFHFDWQWAIFFFLMSVLKHGTYSYLYYIKCMPFSTILEQLNNINYTELLITHLIQNNPMFAISLELLSLSEYHVHLLDHWYLVAPSCDKCQYPVWYSALWTHIIWECTLTLRPDYTNSSMLYLK